MKNNKGFSLVELIVVIAIMAILAAVAIPTFATFITRATEAADEDFASGIEYAVNLALTESGDEAATITVVMDKDNKTIEALSYKLVGEAESDAAHVVIGDGAPADDEVVDTIVATIDKEYKLKTAGPVTVGVVEITVATN